MLRALVDSGAIATIEEDILAEPTLSGTIPIVGADDAHALGFTGSGQTVAILDTGIEGLHSFFGGRIVSEACYSNAGPSNTRRSLCPSGLQTQLGPGAAEATTGQCFDGASNLCRHGSHVAGIAAGNGSSFTGVAKNSNIIAIQVFTRFNSDSDCGSGRSPCVLSYRSDQIKGLERVYALRSAYNIAAANMSLGGGAYTSQAACDAANSSTKAAIDLLRSAGIATVISSGNGGFTNALGAPGCILSAISVGATDDADNVAGFSNSASFLDILAPGVRVTSSVPLGGFASFSGTSMAAPHVTGAWAVFKQLDPSATVSTVEAALKSSGNPVTDFRNGITKPRLDLRTAITDPGSLTLTVTTSGDGAGTIVSGLPGISCGSDCSESYPHSTTVTLTAIPTSGSTFVSWTGACSGSAACVVTMTDDLAVDASFVAVEAPQYSYRVTVENLAGGQALTAPVVATHTGRVRLYRPRRPASAEIQALAENGDSAPLVTWLGADARVSDIATGATGALVPGSDPGGTLLGSSTNILIGADRRAKFLSVASKLVCTNDGFTGLNRVRLPRRGVSVYFPGVSDAGTEFNTEDFADLVPACQSFLGVTSADAGTVVSDPALAEGGRIFPHAGVGGGDDLVPSTHGWGGPTTVRVTVTPLRSGARRFRARLNGTQVVAQDVDGNNTFVDTRAKGALNLRLLPGDIELRHVLAVRRIDDVTEAHIRAGLPNENGPIVATLYGPAAPDGRVSGRLTQGNLTEADLVGPFAGDFPSFLAALGNGELYLSVHTTTNPEGEIRGQIGAR